MIENNNMFMRIVILFKSHFSAKFFADIKQVHVLLHEIQHKTITGFMDRFLA